MGEEIKNKEAGIPNVPFSEMSKEQLLNVINNLIAQNQHLKAAYQQMQNSYAQLSENLSTLDIMFRVLENKDAFPQEFVTEMASAIQNAIVKSEVTESK